MSPIFIFGGDFMGKFHVLPSNVNVVARVISVERAEKVYGNGIEYIIYAAKDDEQDPRYRNIPRICFDFNAGTEGYNKYYESLKPGDIIECIGSVECSYDDENGNLTDSYGIFWHELNVVYKVEEK